MKDGFDIEEQQRFVQWLKRNEMYSELDSAQAMQKAHAVWAVQQSVIDGLKENAIDQRKVINRMEALLKKMPCCDMHFYHAPDGNERVCECEQCVERESLIVERYTREDWAVLHEAKALLGELSAKPGESNG